VFRPRADTPRRIPSFRLKRRDACAPIRRSAHRICASSLLALLLAAGRNDITLN
jgi:hypothetical protein